MSRIITAVIGIPLLVYIIKFTPDAVYSAIVFIAMVLAFREYFVLIQNRNSQNTASGSLAHSGKTLFLFSGLVVAAAIFSSFYFQEIPLQILFPVTAGLFLLLSLFSGLDLPDALRLCVYTLFGCWYVGGLMGYLVGIRMIHPGTKEGRDFVMMLFLIIWANDTFAYFIGKAIGKHKLAVVVSPKKTIEGAVAGLVFGVIVSIVCKYFLIEMTMRDAIAIGLLVGIFGQIGDLCESIIKRAANVKDSGGILPGHGGILDRVDSLLFGAPAMYYYYYFVLAK